MRFALPLGAFFLLVTLLAVGLTLNPREVPSPLVGKEAPVFELPRLHEPARRFSPKEMQGQVWLLNVWASWCVSCRHEDPLARTPPPAPMTPHPPQTHTPTGLYCPRTSHVVASSWSPSDT